MRGDKLVVSAQHSAAASKLVEIVRSRMTDLLVVSVAGESGAGKSEIGSELARLLSDAGVSSDVLQQDDYFVFPPKTNHEMRRANLDQVGLYEVKLDFLDSNLRSFKRRENPVLKPLVDFESDSIGVEERDLSSVSVVVVEGTYTTCLAHADLKVFIDRTYLDTQKHRQARARDIHEPFVDEVLEREHAIISGHRKLAHVIISRDYSDVKLVTEPSVGREEGQ